MKEIPRRGLERKPNGKEGERESEKGRKREKMKRERKREARRRKERCAGATTEKLILVAGVIVGVDE